MARSRSRMRKYRRKDSDDSILTEDHSDDAKLETINGKLDLTTAVECSDGTKLYKCIPTHFLWMPKGLRLCLAWLLMLVFSLLFFASVVPFVLLIPFFWRTEARIIGSSVVLAIFGLSMVLPLKEWPLLHQLPQLWYELLDIHTNLSPAERKRIVADSNKHGSSISAMHPHGIVPFQALIWGAFNDQYLAIASTGAGDEPGADRGKKMHMFGFAAAADAVFRLPLLRNLLGWFVVHGATYSKLREGLVHGRSEPINNAGRWGKHLYLLPGGIAEVFTSKVGRHAIVFKERRGLCRLALECGSPVIPLYVFGGNDFYHSAFSADSYIGKLCRKYRIGITYFYGYLGSLIPFLPRITIAVGSMLPFPSGYEGPGSDVSEKMLEKYHASYLKEMQTLFDKYKTAAGYPGAELEIL